MNDVSVKSAKTGREAANAAGRRGSLFDPLDWAIVRAPLLPVESYLDLARSQAPTESEAGGPTKVEAAWRSRLLADPRTRAALAVGSPSLYKAIHREEGSGKHDPDTDAKLLRYLIRMSTRPTPYGLFAGVALAQWGSRTDLALADSRPLTRTRPDMAWLLRLVFELESKPEVRERLRYIANPLALVRAGRVFLPEAAPTKDGVGSGTEVSVRATSVVRKALVMARTPVSHERLITELAGAPGATIEKAETLVEGLWRQTILLTDLRPPMTEVNPATYVVERLQDIPAAAAVLKQLRVVLSGMSEWDAAPIETAATTYGALLMDSEGDEPAQTEASQVDMALALTGSRISRAVAREAVRAAELLVRMTPLPAGLPYLDAYRQAFAARYGTDREVPILELLDPNFGLGPPRSHFHGGSGGDPRKAALRQQTLYDLAISAFRERTLVVELDEKTLTRLESCAPEPIAAPESLDLSLFVVAASKDDLDAGRFQVVVGPNLGASAAGRNLGRFAHLLGEKAVAALEEVGRREFVHRPDHLWAELVYLPRRFRSANVTIRPHPRPYEIAVGAIAAREPERVIPIDELVVGVRNSRFYVRWPARNADVVGCAGHMLNNLQAPDICRFLDDVRRDGRAQFSSFDWGSAAGLPVLPRVQAGRVVLAPAQWRITAATRAELFPDSRPAFAAGLGKWRNRWQVPRYVYLSFGDNRLLLDLDGEAQAEELRAELRRLADGSQLLLQEALPSPEHAWLDGPQGRYATELIVPLVLRSEPTATAAPAKPPPTAATQDRLRPPGSDWLFVKTYVPRVFEDDLLTGPVAELCEQALTTGAADDWFFIRYADPDPHLRVRFHGHPERLTGELMPLVCAWAKAVLSDGLCSRLCFDTYDREIERFGGIQGMAAAEAIFGADSRAVIEMLRLARGGLLNMDTTSLAVLSIDDLLAGLGASEASLAWYREKGVPRPAAGDEYRRRKTMLRRLLGDPEHVLSQPGGDALCRIFASRKRALSKVGLQLDVLAAKDELSRPKSEILRACVHLHCNRLLAGKAAPEDQILDLVGRTRHGLKQAPLNAQSEKDEQ